MRNTTYRQKAKKDSSDTFFLYVAFHSVWSSFLGLFGED